MSFVADLRIVLRGRDFRRLFATRLTSQASDGAFQVGLASLFFFSPERAATASAAAAALTAALVPYTVVGPFAGVLLDLWPRRQVMLVANGVRAVMVLGVAALVLAGISGPALYVGALACISVNRFFLAGLGAALPHVVPRHELVMANAVSPTSGTLLALVGAGVGFGVIGALGAGDATNAVVLLLAAAGYAGSALVISTIPRHGLGPDQAERAHWGHGWGAVPAAVSKVVRDVVAGARHVHRRRPAALALTAIGSHRIAYGVTTIVSLLLCRNYLNDPADVDAGLALLAQVFAVSGVGFAAAALITPVAAARIGPPAWIVTCFGFASLSQAVFIGWMSVPLLLTGGFALGLAAQGSKICVDAIVQVSVDDAYRGRVFSFYDVVFNAAFIAAAVVAALVVPADGYSPAVYAALSVLYAATAAGYHFAIRSDRPQLDPPRPPR